MWLFSSNSVACARLIGSSILGWILGKSLDIKGLHTQVRDGLEIQDIRILSVQQKKMRNWVKSGEDADILVKAMDMGIEEIINSRIR